MSKVTLQTIADELGVSRTTVSNAFSRPDQLSDELRDRILDTARRLGYAGPDPAARTLRRGEAGVLGVVLKESLAYAFGDPYAIQFLGGLAAQAETARLGVLLIPCPPGSEQMQGVRAAVVDAFAVFSLPDAHSVVDAVIGRRLPSVFVDGPRLPGHPFVGIDDRQAMSDVVRLVVGLAHRLVAVLTFRVVGDNRTGPVDHARLAQVEYRTTAERLRGALETLDAAGIEPTLWEVGLNTRESARVASRELLSRHPRPTAIICLSDQIALGVLEAAAELGIRVPDELSVTGFDDIPQAETAGVTTVRQPASRKGETAWEVLASGQTGEVILPHELVERRTTAPAPD